MIMSSNDCYGWPAKYLFPVDCQKGQVGCEIVGEEGCIVRHVVLLHIEILTCNIYTTRHIFSSSSQTIFHSFFSFDLQTINLRLNKYTNKTDFL